MVSSDKSKDIMFNVVKSEKKENKNGKRVEMRHENCDLS